MPPTQYPPNKILLSQRGPGHADYENTEPAGEAITPGHLIERYDNGTRTAWRKSSSATNMQPSIVALEQAEMNLGVDDPYAIGDLVKAHVLNVGDTFWPLLASGQNIQRGELLQSAGDGTVKAATAPTAAANVAKFMALEEIGSVVVQTRVRVQVIA